METISRQYLLDAEDGQLDACVKPMIQEWDVSPTPLQILKPLDMVINGGLASGLVVTLLQILYDRALKRAGKTHNEIVPDATWRNDRRP